MKRLKIGAIVAGHTPDSEIRQRFDNRVILIDTGMLQSVFGGKPSALEIQGGRFTAHVVGQPPRALASPGTSGTSARPAAGGGVSQQ